MDEKNLTRVRNKSTKEFSRVVDLLSSKIDALEKRVSALESKKAK